MVNGIDAAASYTRLFEGIGSHQMIAGAMPVGHKLVFGAGWVRLGVDDIPLLPDISDLVTPTREDTITSGAHRYFSYSQNAFLFSIARQSNFMFDMGWQYLTLPVSIPVGVTVKYLTASAGNEASGSGIGIDARRSASLFARPSPR